MRRRKCQVEVRQQYRLLKEPQQVRLLVRGQQVFYRPKIGVILKTQIQPPIQSVAQAHAWL
jgi:hypothetical protein